jgi:hypothetical protein
MSRALTVEEFADSDWFPSGIAQAIDPAAEQAPLGFEAWRLHTVHDSHLMVWPSGDLDDVAWWQRMLPVGGGGKRWGEAPDLAKATVERSKGWGGPTYEIQERTGRRLVAKILPLDECGHGRTLSELNCEILDAATGGIQWKGRDIVLFFRRNEGEIAADLASTALEDGDFSAACAICRRSGATLAAFHTAALLRRSLPNDERRWNNRLKELEERVVSNTLWRAPHSSDTRATITHRNFGLESVRIDDDEAILCNCFDGVPNAILPASVDYPVLRDVAAGYRSISRLSEKHSLSQEEEHGLRKEFFEGWQSAAPASARSSRALDSHKGGVPIWEYEQVLEESACAQAWGKETTDRIKWWLGHVSRIQAAMYASRTISAASLLAVLLAAAAPFSEQWIPAFTDRIVATLAFAGAAVLLRWLYRKRAPPPY